MWREAELESARNMEPEGREEEEAVRVSRDAEERGEESWRGGRILMRRSACVLPSDLPAAET